MNNIKVSIDRIIIEYTKISMNFFNSYFMRNICDYYGIKPTIGKTGFHYKLNIKEYDDSYLYISYKPYHQSNSLSYSLWIEIHPKYLERFRNILDALNLEAKEINFVLCDVAYDIPYSMNNVFIASNTGRKMNLYEGTKYFGERKDSKNHGYCRVYDKKKEQKKKKNKEVGRELTRVEIVYGPDSKERFNLLDLLNRPPLFNKYYNYFDEKVADGKTSGQALVCIMRRLVNIIYGMMKNKTAYRPYVVSKEPIPAKVE